MAKKSEKTKKEKTAKPKAVKKEKAIIKAVSEPVAEIKPGVEEVELEEKMEAETGADSDKEGKPQRYYEAVGRRKSAIARVRLFTKGSEIVVNGRPFQDYFSIPELRQIVEAPFRKMKNFGKFRTEIKVVGGGLKGQAEAVRHGISRALTEFNADFRKRLKKAGYLTRDARVKERKKYGLKKARRAPQWAKR